MKFGYNNVGTRLRGKTLENCGDFWKDKPQLTLTFQGGTGSQWREVTDGVIAQWVTFQQTTGCRLMYITNLNHAKSEDDELWNRCAAAGLQFFAIRHGNENYLNKYRRGKKEDFREVTGRTENMTPIKFLQLCDEYTKRDLPTFLQLAPIRDLQEGGHASLGRNTAWNDAMFEYGLDDCDGFCLHIYANENFNLDYLADIQSVIGEKELHITEFGYRDGTKGITEGLEWLINEVRPHLKEQDAMYLQVFWNSWQNDVSAMNADCTGFNEVGDAYYPFVVGESEQPVLVGLSPWTIFGIGFQVTYWSDGTWEWTPRLRADEQLTKDDYGKTKEQLKDEIRIIRANR